MQDLVLHRCFDPSGTVIVSSSGTGGDGVDVLVNPPGGRGIHVFLEAGEGRRVQRWLDAWYTQVDAHRREHEQRSERSLVAVLEEWSTTPYFETRAEWALWVDAFRPRVLAAVEQAKRHLKVGEVQRSNFEEGGH